MPLDAADDDDDENRNEGDDDDDDVVDDYDCDDGGWFYEGTGVTTNALTGSCNVNAFHG